MLWRQSIECSPLTNGSTKYPGLVADQRLGVEKLSLLNAFMSSLRGERKTKVLGGTGNWLNPGLHRVKLEGSCMALANSTSHMMWILHVCMCLKGIPDLGGYLFNLIPCLKYLIWFILNIIINEIILKKNKTHLFLILFKVNKC